MKNVKMGKLLSFVFFMLTAIQSFGMVVEVTLIWNRDLDNYNLQEGSIIQVIGYTRPGSSPPNEGNSFDELEPGVYDPESVPEGHEILYETSIGADIAPGRRYEFFDFFITDSIFNRVYIRFFESTGFSEEVQLSYWGLSPSAVVHGGTIYAHVWRNLDADYSGQFAEYFEVIPEPGSSALVILGFVTMALFRLIRFYGGRQWPLKLLLKQIDIVSSK